MAITFLYIYNITDPAAQERRLAGRQRQQREVGTALPVG
jgi:hypothetical protein